MREQKEKSSNHFRQAWEAIESVLQAIENTCSREVVLFAYDIVGALRQSDLKKQPLYQFALREAQLLKRLVFLMREVVPEDESRVWDNPGYKPKVEYDEMRAQFFECWACHATRKPREYYGPWMLERAHVCNKPRKEDRRAVIMLCTICHKASHGEIVVGFEVPKLSVSEMIVLKRERDPEWFDLPFLQKCSIRKLHIADPFPRLSEEFYTLRERNKLRCS